MTPRPWRSVACAGESPAATQAETDARVLCGCERPARAVRWLKFNLVGGMGIAVQLLVLIWLKTGLHFNYLIATALAVETAVIHNFLWHERFTWADRFGGGWVRFLKFNLTTGLFSIAGNLALMKVLVGLGHVNYLLANAITITACSIVNFLVSDGFVFAERPARNHSM
jgi:putative flippase GtrA